MRSAKLMSYLLVGASLLSACSSNEGDITGNKSTYTQTRLVEVELSASTPASDNLRLAQQVDPTTGKATKPLMSDKNVNIRLAVSADGVDPVYQTLEFTKVQGENRAIYKGQLQVPVTGASSYKISGILLGEVGGETFTTLESDGTVKAQPAQTLATAESNIVSTKIPYVAQETSAQLDASGKVMQPTVLQFKPSGTLLRFQVQNNTGAEQTFSRIVITSNAFFTEWSYNLAQLTRGNLLAGSTSSLDSWSKTYEISPITLANGETSSQYYYIWVMPRPESGTSLKTEVVVRNTDNKSYLGAKRTISMPQGGLRLVLKPEERVSTTPACFTGGYLPHEYVEMAYVNPTMNGLVPITDSDTNYNTTKWGYLTWYQAQTIKISGYHVPTIQEWQSIFPTANYTWGKTNKTDVTENCTIGGETLSLKADYLSTTSDPDNIYSIRFKDSENCRRMAIRYQRTVSAYTQTNTTARFIITIKYVGDRDDVDINTISSSADFWKTYDAQLSFPITGQWYGKGGYFTYKHLQLWSSSGSGDYGDNAFASAAEYIDASLRDSKSYLMPVVLFKDKP